MFGVGMSLVIGAVGPDIIATWINYNLETAVPLQSGQPMGGSPIMPHGLVLLEDGVEISNSFEFELFQNDEMSVRYANTPFNPAAVYRIVSIMPMPTTNSLEGFTLPPFIVSTELIL